MPDARRLIQVRSRRELVKDRVYNPPSLISAPLFRRLGRPYLDWQINEGGGPLLRDPFHGRNGTITSVGTWQQGNVGLEWKADGVADFMGFDGGHELTNFSNEIIYTPTTATSEPIWTHAESPGDGTHDRNIFIGSGGNYHWRIFDGGVKDLDSGVAAVANKTVHILVTSDGTNMRIYIDGVQAATQAAGDAFTGFTTPEITILRGYDGSSPNTFGDGAVALARVWEYALNANQVAYLFLNRFGRERPNYYWTPAAAVGGRIMSSLAGAGGLAGRGGIAGQGGGLAG